MEFSTLLNNYIEKLDCTSKELSNKSGISEAVISRYRNGDRIPKYDSKQFNLLIKGLCKIASLKNININEKMIIEDFNQIYNTIDKDIFINNLNILIKELKINVADLSRYLGFDASYISKIRNGERNPKNINDFTNGICKYIYENYTTQNDIDIIKNIINYNKDDYYGYLVNWISNNKNEENIMDSFLIKLDDFDLNEYIKSIKFDKLKVPTMPIEFPKSKTYFGLQGFKDSQLDVLKGIVLSKSKEDVFFYSNMPMVEGSEDLDFTKKFMFGLAMILKKEQHINVIHNLDRPLNELIMGLEGWIPLYMTGLISPYYFKESFNSIYNTIDCTGGTYSLSGRCINGNVNKSTFYLTNKKDEIKYYKDNSKILLKKASSLIDIYNSAKEDDYNRFINNIKGNIKNIYYNLPIYTISDDLLNKILDRNNINENDKQEIFIFVNNEKKRIEKILKNNTIIDEINELSNDDFKLTLSLSNMFYDKKINYTYEEYLEHLKLIKEYKNNHKNYNYKMIHNSTFKNINISILEDNLFIISKENAPSIHFVFNHPSLINAMKNYKCIIKEKD